MRSHIPSSGEAVIVIVFSFGTCPQGTLINIIIPDDKEFKEDRKNKKGYIKESRKMPSH